MVEFEDYGDPDLNSIMERLASFTGVPDPLIESPIKSRALNWEDYQEYTPRYFEPVGSKGGSYQKLDTARTESIITDLSSLLYNRDPLSLWSLAKRFDNRYKFPGGGIYALYYQGNLPIYGSVSSEASDFPIYIGKSFSLEGRFRAHIATLNKSNIPITHISYKLIVLPRPWTLQVEDNLIERYRPVWNGLRGFGSGERERGWGVHTPGRTTNWASYHSTEKKPVRVRSENPDILSEVEDLIKHFTRVSRFSFDDEMARIKPFIVSKSGVTGVTPGNVRLSLVR